METRKRNLLLINPWIYDFAAYDLWAKPLGLLYLAALLEKNDWKVNYIDCLDIYHPALRAIMFKHPKRTLDHRGHFYREEVDKPPLLQEIPRRFYRFGLPPKVFRKVLQTLPFPEAILVTSGMTYWYLGVHEVISTVKEVFPSVPVILGGIYATLCPDHAKRLSGADFIIRGWGEVQVTKVLEELTGISSLFPSDLNDIDVLPSPAFQHYSRIDYVCILTSRGCPFRCTYCASHILNDGFLRRNPARVVEEIIHWVKEYGVEDIAFYDDALLVDPSSLAVPIFHDLIAKGIKIRFHTPNGIHARWVTQEIAFLMRKAGFTTIRLGLETSSMERQLATGEKVSNEVFREAVRNLQRAGYSPEEIGVYILVGLPGQSKEEVEDTIHFVWNCGARPYLAEYSPIPGTHLWEEAIKISPFDLKGEPLFHNNTILPLRWEGLQWGDLRDLKGLIQKEGDRPVAT